MRVGRNQACHKHTSSDKTEMALHTSEIHGLLGHSSEGERLEKKLGKGVEVNLLL